MISYYDKFSQVIVAQTLNHEEISKENQDAEKYWFLSHLVMIKSTIPHIDYVLMVSERDVDENGIALEIGWRADRLPDLAASVKPLTGYLSNEELNIDSSRPMVGAFFNHGTESHPSWGSHS